MFLAATPFRVFVLITCESLHTNCFEILSYLQKSCQNYMKNSHLPHPDSSFLTFYFIYFISTLSTHTHTHTHTEYHSFIFCLIQRQIFCTFTMLYCNLYRWQCNCHLYYFSELFESKLQTWCPISPKHTFVETRTFFCVTLQVRMWTA